MCDRYTPTAGFQELTNLNHQLEVMKMMKDGVPENEIFARAKELKELEEREREEQAAQQRGARRNTITAAFGKVSKSYRRTLHLRTLSSVHPPS